MLMDAYFDRSRLNVCNDINFNVLLKILIRRYTIHSANEIMQECIMFNELQLYFFGYILL